MEKEKAQMKISEDMKMKEGQVREMMREVRNQQQRSKDTVQRVKEQEIQIAALQSCIEQLQQHVVDINLQMLPDKYQKYDEMLKVFARTESMVEAVNQERTLELNKDVLDLAMRRVSVQTEAALVTGELNKLIEKYGKQLDLETLGL